MGDLQLAAEGARLDPAAGVLIAPPRDLQCFVNRLAVVTQSNCLPLNYRKNKIRSGSYERRESGRSAAPTPSRSLCERMKRVT